MRTYLPATFAALLLLALALAATAALVVALHLGVAWAQGRWTPLRHDAAGWHLGFHRDG